MTGAIGFVLHPAVAGDLPLLAEARRQVDAAGWQRWEVSRDRPARLPLAQMRGTQLILTLGGDGTFLHGARIAAPRNVPVLGVNLGRLGFLTELDAPGLGDGLRRFQAGDYRLEERTILAVTVERDTRVVSRMLAVNEAVISKGGDPKLIRMAVSVEGVDVGTFDADGTIVATASGSTAYALALGGPILEPGLRDLVLVPMNPFALTVRPIVFSPGNTLTIAVPKSPAYVSTDGVANRRLAPGDRIVVRSHPRPLRVVRFGQASTFFERLRDKIGWGAPLVPMR
jgi:NAD+ kinase